MEDKTVQPQENDKAAQEKDSRKPTIFRVVFSSILGAVIGSVPGVLMSLLSEKNSRVDKFSGHTTMIGGMIGAMVGHDLVKWEHSRPGAKEEKESRGR
jgi:uncharacterized membrane protein YeaQ/YmgE (transglycosylase-associated protein family)